MPNEFIISLFSTLKNLTNHLNVVDSSWTSYRCFPRCLTSIFFAWFFGYPVFWPPVFLTPHLVLLTPRPVLFEKINWCKHVQNFLSQTSQMSIMSAARLWCTTWTINAHHIYSTHRKCPAHARRYPVQATPHIYRAQKDNPKDQMVQELITLPKNYE